MMPTRVCESEEEHTPERQTRPIILRINARIRFDPDSPPSRQSILNVDGKAGPFVSSGCWFGNSCGYPSVEAAEQAYKNFIESQVRWFKDSYNRSVKVKENLVHETETQTKLFPETTPVCLVSATVKNADTPIP